MLDVGCFVCPYIPMYLHRLYARISNHTPTGFEFPFLLITNKEDNGVSWFVFLLWRESMDLFSLVSVKPVLTRQGRFDVSWVEPPT